ncbi:hypothetical protein [Pedobacter suwonensis]|uniref:hypothetical protein n=1 Tax=Pedobacter suwonensis TaxID=332999 RepID=UPI0011A24EC9|nr:hypothetical protein [Pedobacter suwonensis]
MTELTTTSKKIFHNLSTDFLNPWKDQIQSLVLFIVPFIVLQQSLHNSFQVYWDDHWVLFNTYTSDGLTIANLKAIFSQFYNGQYSPLNQLYYTIIYSLFGYKPFYFHFSALLIHLVNVQLVYRLVKSLLGFVKHLTTAQISQQAFFVSLIFGIHPFLIEPVAWISASKILIYASFYIGACLCYLNYIRSKKISHLFGSALFFLLSFGAKEQAVAFSLTLFTFDYLAGRNFKDKQLWIEKIPFLLLSLVLGLVTIMSQADNGEGLISMQKKYPFYQTLIFACYCLFEYFVKCLIPIRLLYVYPFPNEIGKPLPNFFYFYPTVLLLLTAIGAKLIKDRFYIFCLLFFIVNILLTIHIIPISRFSIISDRYVYISSIGAFMIIVGLLFSINTIGKKFQMMLLIGYVVLLSAYSTQRIKVWYNSDSLKKELKQLIRNRPMDYQKKTNN